MFMELGAAVATGAVKPLLDLVLVPEHVLGGGEHGTLYLSGYNAMVDFNEA